MGRRDAGIPGPAARAPSPDTESKTRVTESESYSSCRVAESVDPLHSSYSFRIWNLVMMLGDGRVHTVVVPVCSEALGYGSIGSRSLRKQESRTGRNVTFIVLASLALVSIFLLSRSGEKDDLESVTAKCCI